MDNRMQYAYIVGVPRSGSTLLSMLLNAHSEIGSGGELEITKDLSSSQKIICSCGQEIVNCQFWNKVKDICYQRSIDLDLQDFKTKLHIEKNRNINRILFGLPNKNIAFIQSIRENLFWNTPFIGEWFKHRIQRSINIAQAVLDITDKHVYLDAAKNANRAFYLEKNSTINLKLIHLVRDVRGTVNSFLKFEKDMPVKKIIDYWITRHEAILRLKSKLSKDSYLLVRYEELCKEPEKVLKSICEFLNVMPIDLLNIVNDKPHHLIGNRMLQTRFQGIRIDDGWQKNLREEQVAECLNRGRDMSRLLGYAL